MYVPNTYVYIDFPRFYKSDVFMLLFSFQSKYPEAFKDVEDELNEKEMEENAEKCSNEKSDKNPKEKKINWYLFLKIKRKLYYFW